MPIDLPPEPPIDESRRGILTINEGGLLALLGLKGHRIEEMRITTGGNLQVELVGEDMPIGTLPKPVVLICHVGGDQRELSWEHKPEKRWRVR
jgi:hypothetical protein